MLLKACSACAELTRSADHVLKDEVAFQTLVHMTSLPVSFLARHQPAEIIAIINFVEYVQVGHIVSLHTAK